LCYPPVSFKYHPDARFAKQGLAVVQTRVVRPLYFGIAGGQGATNMKTEKTGEK
jgi:hypothetical protein